MFVPKPTSRPSTPGSGRGGFGMTKDRERRRISWTYVSAQLGHSNPRTTLKYCPRLIPSRGERWVDLLARRLSWAFDE